MDKLKMHTPDLIDDNISKIALQFPNCITESRSKDGSIKKSIDFDLLRQELSDSIVEGPKERYQLNWPGKREALLAANAPIAKTLRPCRDESVNFDTTENLFIEGDNLDALKLLQENYLGKVKMIYIDPPYNTGKDFIYSDNFTESAEEYLLESEQKDEEGNHLIANTESNGRFHSDWLSMMYSRLKLAKNLLKEDGAIFISIDDNEVHNLRKICDEIFGITNFIAEFVWKRRVSSAMADNNVSSDQDYVICYQKGQLEGFTGNEKDFKKYSNPDNDPRGPWISDNLTVGMTASMRPNQAYNLVDPSTGSIYPYNPNRVWAFIPKSMEKMIAEGRVIFPEDISRRPMQKRFKNELKSTHNPFSTLMSDKVGLNTEATRQIQQVLGGNIFDYSKPLSLLTVLISQVCNGDDLILDFFAGSSVTAHAVMQLNAEDKGNRKFIMVQLPEECDEKSEAFKAGYKTIAEISKERIRRAGAKIKDENPDATDLDIGFRVLKVDSSNMADVYYSPDAMRQDLIAAMTDNIKAGRSEEDLLFQVLLDWGVDLSLPIKKEVVAGLDVFFVDENSLAACFANNGEITEDFCKKLAEYKPLRIVFRDSGFKGDSVKINVEQIFKLMSPHTEVKTI
ncbi:site-specific DNA-methyltransferase [Maridesulfovibrio ferrireducens]|uniref:site-specific DNA-methyltransferase n=1 Tax=Maridesulfovibrio ferrireducens TaxID=246191 RepID=UPI001A271B89|nr:site-specific DNA-methyltransferase [Maridesulfovibrio ferrireducens]MBI9112381.1 site-specific DNA-methyltransferase [Maridesulfovibrio ferrireducens]